MSNELYLTKPQSEFLKAQERFVAFVGGFGSGKTEALLVKMLHDKLEWPDVDLAYFAPTYPLVRDIAYDRVVARLVDIGLPHKLNKAEAILYIDGYGKIIFRTMDKPERIVGFNIGRAYIDELDTMPMANAAHAWQKIIARVRQKSPDPHFTNQIAVATTPEGYRFVYDRWVKNGGEQYRVIRAPTHSNPYLPEGYIDSLRATYPPQLIDAYIEGEFVNLTSGAVYYNFDRKENATREYFKWEHPSFPPGTKEEAIHVGIDFNVYNMSAVLFVERNGVPYAITEFTGVRDTPTMLDLIEGTYGHLTHRFVFYPDATGKKRSSTNANTSDLALIQARGHMVDAPAANPPVQDRINAVNAVLLNGKGERRFFINTALCPKLTDALEQQVYDQNGLPDKSAGLDHILDAMGYYIHRRYPITAGVGLTKPVLLGV